MSDTDYSAEIERMLGGAGDNPTPGAPPTGDPLPASQVPNPGAQRARPPGARWSAA